MMQTARCTARGLWIALVIASLCIVGCSNIEKAPPRPEAARVDPSFQIDVPQIMRGTVASEAVILGYESPLSAGYRPVIARGYGLVVGLNGTGSRDIPPQIRAHMLAEASRGGFGSERFGRNVAGISPETLLDSPDTAVVVVEGIIPQGAVKGTRFDVRVYSDPRTGTTSLEGGRLYTTLLRPGALATGGGQAFELAEAAGPVFVNPFAEPGAVGQDTVLRTTGRILNGGMVAKDMPLKLRLANPSHARAATIQNAINTRFPIEHGQRDPTARGESEESIELTVPPSFAGRTDEFVELLTHTTIRQANPEAVAMSVRRAVLANPIIATPASIRWQALGNRVLPIIRDLYEYAEVLPRFAALRAGAKLNDALVVPHLIDLAQSGDAIVRPDAINLLSEMGLNPRIDKALRGLLDDNDVEVRLAAYEALVTRRDPYMQRIEVDGKFILDQVESDKPLIYITQTGWPRIVIFGTALEIERPMTVNAWSNRLMIKEDSQNSTQLEVYYRPPDSSQGVIHSIDVDLVSFLAFLGHTPTIEEPEPGLGLTYGETVGALHQIWKSKYVQADFKAEQDRILAQILQLQSQPESSPTRPEFIEQSQ